MYQAMALAAVALIGYLFGKIGRQKPTLNEQPGELKRATQVALQLEAIADDLRHELARHREKVEYFKRKLVESAQDSSDELDEQAWRRLEELSEEMLGPTMQLGGQLSGAYDRIRRQTQSLTHFTDGRSDRLTGLGNSKALEEQLELLLQEQGSFSLAMLSVAPASETTDTNRDSSELLPRVANLLHRTLKQTDFAARYGLEEIVVVMPDAGQQDAKEFGDQIRAQSHSEAGAELCCGIAESLPSDTPKSVLARADSALYSARAAGAGRQYLHSGAGIFPADTQSPTPAGVPESAAC